jgi:plastocyanin
MQRSLWCGAALVVAAALACNNPSGGDTCKSVGANVTIDAHDQGGFTPTPITVTAGQSVCWQNLGSVTHTVTTVLPATDTVDAALPPGALFVHTFSTITDINYYCVYHQATEQGVLHVR